jgi:HKD family nuclease
MPSSITFWHSDPRRRFRAVVEGDLQTATDLDVAVAFMTEAGVDFLLGCLGGSISAAQCRVSVSVHFPTDLKALRRLSARLGEQLHIHLGSQTPKEKSSKSSPLLHSKVVWIGRVSGATTIFIGSHNWTSAALDGANMEASIRVECKSNEPFAQEVRAHLDACFDAGVRFNPADLDFYRSLQARLHPSLLFPHSEEIGDFLHVPSAPAVVIHAEDNRTDGSPNLGLYIPKGREPPDNWLSANLRTRVYLYLYPAGSLLGRNPPSANPVLFEGEVRTFSDIKNPIDGQQANCQIRDLNRPVLETLSPPVIPAAGWGVQAQVVASLTRRGGGSLPVYVVDRTRPGIRVEPIFEEQQPERREDREDETHSLPWEIMRYYESGSFRSGRFIFQVPRSSRTTTVTVPGQAFYRVPPQQTLTESLRAREIVPVVKVAPRKLSTVYVYQVYFVFSPPQGTHAS